MANITSVALAKAVWNAYRRKRIPNHVEENDQILREWLEVTDGREDWSGYKLRLDDSVEQVRPNVRMSDEVHDQMKKRAKEMQVPLSTAMRFAIEFAVELDSNREKGEKHGEIDV